VNSFTENIKEQSESCGQCQCSDAVTWKTSLAERVHVVVLWIACACPLSRKRNAKQAPLSAWH